jgi:hypothetical protein
VLQRRLDIDQERRRRALQIADAAKALSKTAGSLPAMLPKLNLSKVTFPFL